MITFTRCETVTFHGQRNSIYQTMPVEFILSGNPAIFFTAETRILVQQPLGDGRTRYLTTQDTDSFARYAAGLMQHGVWESDWFYGDDAGATDV